MAETSYFKILSTKVTEEDLRELRRELDPAIECVEEHFAKYGDAVDFPDFHGNDRKRRGEVIYCLGQDSPVSQFGYPTSQVEIRVREFPRYWMCYYIYKDRRFSYREFISFVPKFHVSAFAKVQEIAKRCNRETGYKMGLAPKTANILRTPPGCSWYRHKDVMNPKLVIPIYSDDRSVFHWYATESAEDLVSLAEMPVKTGQVHMVNTHEWHTTKNFSDSNVRWNLTFEEPWPGPQ